MNSANTIGFANVQGLSFSPFDGKLYGINPPLNNPVEIITIDTTTGIGAKVSQFPLGFGGGSLAFKSDGTLWTVNLIGVLDSVMFTDSLIQIDYSTNPGTVPVNFPTLEESTTFGPFSLFQAINALCYAPQGAPDQAVPTFREIDAVGVDNNGSVLASAGDTVFGFDPDFQVTPSGINAGGLEQFLNIAIHPMTNRAYVRDGVSGKVYEFEPGSLGATRSIQYRPAARFFELPRYPAMGLDPVNNNLYLAGDFQMHRVNLGSEMTDEIDNGAADTPEALTVDPVRRRLHVNMQLSGPGGCSSIRTYNLDTLEVVGEICVSDYQIFNMAFDPARNRIAANARFVVPSFSTHVRFFNMDTFTEEAFSPLLLQEASDGTNPSDAFLAMDSDRNQLLIARPDTPARLEFYGLPD